MECQKEKNKESCNCTYDCETKGICCECIREHRKKSELPACYFSSEIEKTYDRSIENFIKSLKR
ncbi:MAG: hypothetical protein CO140_01115 [Candidatus Moranbacteria bacterium CG_4_9_14_3_um_filter_40_7]|nr:MAG: hypothetical protein COX31_02780 [Candidatus Moranbacteria bacterium CG23_combo_of_CG06-09_8_20_14_all_40_16]PIU80301.1 MAG: hypothetical protein COS71_04125 [Candidatus Moranbacteria bacterium CG06_land_8_20_14_3_00_40_12]PJA88022.1 MAG: hypothetical protein CO140_01115 [Candidatus Moranbacteria bacterium CG_4_9_14_3_um_filter_40_7]